MKYDISSIEENYNVKLDGTQKAVLSSLINFIYTKDEQCICLRASAGTGNL